MYKNKNYKATKKKSLRTVALIGILLITHAFGWSTSFRIVTKFENSYANGKR